MAENDLSAIHPLPEAKGCLCLGEQIHDFFRSEEGIEPGHDRADPFFFFGFVLLSEVFEPKLTDKMPLTHIRNIANKPLTERIIPQKLDKFGKSQSRIMEKHETATSQDVLKTRPPTGLLSSFMSPQPLEHVHQPAFIQINTSLGSDQKIKAAMKTWLTRLIV